MSLSERKNGTGFLFAGSIISVVVVSCTFMCDWSAGLWFSSRGLRAECGLHPWLYLLIKFRADRATYLLWVIYGCGCHDVVHQGNLYFFLSSCAKTGKNTAVWVICLLLLLQCRTMVTFHAWCMTFVTCVAWITFRCHGVDHMLLLLLAHLEIVRVHWWLSSGWISLYPLASFIHHDSTSKWALRLDCDWNGQAMSTFCSVDIISLVHLIFLFSIVTFRHLFKL